MAPSFQDREQAFEAKYAHDQEFLFLVTARRDKLLARWAADRHGMSDTAREKLLQAVLAIPNSCGHDRAVLDMVSKFVAAYGNPPDEFELQAAMERSAQQAKKGLLEGTRVL